MKEPNLKAFLERRYRIRGVVFVGANDGEEIPWLLDNGCRPILAFEPHPDAVNRARERFTNTLGITYIQCALGETDTSLEFFIPQDEDDEKTSRYKPIPTTGHEWTSIPTGYSINVPVVRFDNWCKRNNIDMSVYDALIVDAQGMELEVLKGIGNYLRGFEFLCIELSAKPVYNGEVSALEVINYLRTYGFVQFTDIKEHDDVLFIKQSLVR